MDMKRSCTVCTRFLNGLLASIVFFCFAGNVLAIGLGEVHIRSHIGERLRASIQVSGDTSQLATACMHATLDTIDHEQLMTATTSVITDASGVAYLEIRSSNTVYEPATYLKMSVDCKDNVYSREYAILLDAPVASEAPEAAVEEAIPSVVTAQPEPSATIRHRLGHHARRNGPASTLLRQSAMPAVRSAASPTAAAVTMHAAQQATPPTSHQKTAQTLKLEPVLSLGEPEMSQSPAITHAPTESSPAMHLSPNLQLAQKEHQIEQLRAQIQQQMTEIRQLQARSLPAQPTSRKLLVAVALLAILELILLAVLLRDRRRQQLSIDVALATRPPAAIPDDEVFRALLESHTEHAGATVIPPSPVSPRQPVAESNRAAPEVLHEPAHTPAIMPMFGEEHMQVEEISDITQEAEFWISVNNPEKAILVLEHQISDESPGHRESPAPWLFLLDLYRSTGQREAYENLRERFSGLFNARTLDFDEDPATANLHQIEDYPHIIRNISELWRTDDVIPYLKSLMLANPEHKRIGFDLPVYRDILMMLSLAQEMSAIRHAELLAKGPENRSSGGKDELDLDIPNIHEAFRVIDPANGF